MQMLTPLFAANIVVLSVAGLAYYIYTQRSGASTRKVQ